MNLEDTLYPLLKLYKNLPGSFKYGLGKLYRIIPKRIKYGSFYFSYVKRIKNFNNEKVELLLSQQIQLATNKIPFYKDKKFTSLGDFPIVNKKTINENFDVFFDSFNIHKLKSNTGGSSGNPFEFYIQKGISRPKEKAHFDWYWAQFGYKAGDKILMIRGESLAEGKLYEYQPIENKLALSCYLLNSNNVNEVIIQINDFKPKFIHAYPSALKNFMNLIIKEKSTLNINIKAVFLGSEGLAHADRKFISSYFKTKISHWYGQSERLVHAGNCPYSDDLHIFPFYGYVELCNDDDTVIIDPEVKGRIIATGFDNEVMPFIRYDTGDEAEYSKNTECKCGFIGKSFRIIHGRKQDYIFLNDGTKVSLTAFIFGQHFEEFSAINEIQLEQNAPGELIVRIVLKENNIIIKEKFIEKLKKSVQEKITISVQIVEYITKTERGKHVFLIQNIKV